MPPKRKQTAEIDDRPKKKGKTKPPTFETGQVRRRQRRDVLIIDDVDELELQNVTDHIDREISKSQRNNKQLDTRKSLQSTKVRTKEHIPLLRNSTQSSISSKLDFISTCRDHYDRFNLFLSQQYPLSPESTFADPFLTKAATSAPRHSKLGLVDTLAREFITYWLAEVENFLATNHPRNGELQMFEPLWTGLKEHVRKPLQQTDCSNCRQAQQLRFVMLDWLDQYFVELYNDCKSNIPANKRCEYQLQLRPLTIREKSSHLSETRILNSSAAWDLHVSPYKKEDITMIRFVEGPIQLPDYTTGPNPADNGVVWHDSGVNLRPIPRTLDELVNLPLTGRQTREGNSSGPSKYTDRQSIVISDDGEPSAGIDRLFQGKLSLTSMSYC